MEPMSWMVFKLLLWAILQLLVVGLWVQHWMQFYQGVNVEKITDKDGNVVSYRETYSGARPNWRYYIFWDLVLLLVMLIFM